MKTRMLAIVPAAFILTAFPAVGGVFNQAIDLSGSTSDGLWGDASNTIVVVNIDDGGQGLMLTGFSWDISFMALSPSWASESRIDITSPSGRIFTFSGTEAGWGNASGMFSHAGSTDEFENELIAGDWEFRFYESFDDAISPDGMYEHAVFTIEVVPAPGGMMVLALVAGIAHRGRRRQ